MYRIYQIMLISMVTLVANGAEKLLRQIYFCNAVDTPISMHIQSVFKREGCQKEVLRYHSDLRILQPGYHTTFDYTFLDSLQPSVSTLIAKQCTIATTTSNSRCDLMASEATFFYAIVRKDDLNFGLLPLQKEFIEYIASGVHSLIPAYAVVTIKNKTNKDFKFCIRYEMQNEPDALVMYDKEQKTQLQLCHEGYASFACCTHVSTNYENKHHVCAKICSPVTINASRENDSFTKCYGIEVDPCNQSRPLFYNLIKKKNTYVLEKVDSFTNS